MTAMRRVSVPVILGLAALLLAGCMHGTLNPGEDQEPIPGPKVTATFTVDTQWSAGETATLTVTWTGGNAPFMISADMGGGTTEDIPAGTPATSPITHQFALINGDWWTYKVVVTDSMGRSGIATGTYSSSGHPYPDATITNVTFDAGVLTVEVHSGNRNAELAVEVTVPEGLEVDSPWKAASQTTGTAVFFWGAANVVAGGSGETHITAYDNLWGGLDRATQPIEIPPLEIPDDALCAVASDSHVTVGGETTVVVACGDFPPDKPFQYANGVAVTVEEGASYVEGTLNVGAVGGDTKDSDGLWANMSPLPGSYLLPDDSMIFPIPADGEWARVFFNFNVTPIFGGEVTAGGPLFNFGLTFDHAGAYTLGFLEFQDVKRTYYSDSASTEYSWSDISNAGVPNTITVTE